MNIWDVMHAIVDRTPFHTESERTALHDAIQGKAEGFETGEEYRKSLEEKAAAPANQAAEDQLLAQAAEIQRRRGEQESAAAAQREAIAARDAEAAAARPAAPGPPAGTLPQGEQGAAPIARPPAPGF